VDRIFAFVARYSSLLEILNDNQRRKFKNGVSFLLVATSSAEDTTAKLDIQHLIAAEVAMAHDMVAWSGGGLLPPEGAAASGCASAAGASRAAGAGAVAAGESRKLGVRLSAREGSAAPAGLTPGWGSG
jgi:hypothetical protein